MEQLAAIAVASEFDEGKAAREAWALVKDRRVLAALMEFAKIEDGELRSYEDLAPDLLLRGEWGTIWLRASVMRPFDGQLPAVTIRDMRRLGKAMTEVLLNDPLLFDAPSSTPRTEEEELDAIGFGP